LKVMETEEPLEHRSREGEHLPGEHVY
jgi:hypothetical protein